MSPEPAPQPLPASRPTVGLFATCLVDVFRPAVAEAAVRLLRRAGFEVVVPEAGCCGQAHFNDGDPAGARDLVLGLARAFAGVDHVVVPSGSCAAMLRVHGPALFAPGTSGRDEVLALAGRVHELTELLAGHAWAESPSTPGLGPVAWHDSCSGLRDLGLAAPRKLLDQVPGLDLREIPGAEACCGFGGAFCLKYPQISAAIADRKLDAIGSTGAAVVTGTDLGCLMHLEGRARRRGQALAALHVAEILAGPGESTDGGA